LLRYCSSVRNQTEDPKLLETIDLYIQPFIDILPLEESAFDDAFNEVPCGAICAVTFPDVVPLSLAADAIVLFDDAFNEVPCGAICAVTFPDVVSTCAYIVPLQLVKVEIIPKISANVIAIIGTSFIIHICI
jgi:hypothetical protein